MNPNTESKQTNILTEKFLTAWHQTISTKDLNQINKWIADDVTLISPAMFKPKVGKHDVVYLLTDVLTSLDKYTVKKTWIDGGDILLEFEAMVGDRYLEGIDRITLNADGKMSQLRVYIRPYNGLTALMLSVARLQVNRMKGFKKRVAQLRLAMKGN